MKRELQEAPNNTMESVFGKFGEMFKEFKEGLTYNAYDEIKIYFDSNMLELDDTTNIELIIDEINRISRRLFMYGVICESQERILQQLEDDFATWHAARYTVIDQEVEPVKARDGSITTKRISRTEGAKEQLIIYAGGDDYEKFQENLRIEKYKLGLVKRTVSSLDSYSYKLHAIMNYRQLAVQKRL